MHEISVMMEVIRIVDEMAEKNSINHVAEIAFEIGECSAVIPMFMEEYFPVLTSEKPLYKDCKLKFNTIQAGAVCNACGKPFKVVENEGKCPFCQSEDKTFFSGNEFSIREVVVDEPKATS